MIVRGSEGIAHVAAVVRRSLLPKATDPYVATDARMTAMLLDLIGEDYERCVDVMLRDDREVRDLFTRASSSLDDALRAHVQRWLQDEAPPDWRVSTLSARADRTMALFIEVHAQVEAQAHEGRSGAQALDLALWRFIEDYAERRRYHSDI